MSSFEDRFFDRSKYRFLYESLDTSHMTELVADAYKHIFITYHLIAADGKDSAKKYCNRLLEFYYLQLLEMTTAEKARISHEIERGEFKTWED